MVGHLTPILGQLFAIPAHAFVSDQLQASVPGRMVEDMTKPCRPRNYRHQTCSLDLDSHDETIDVDAPEDENPPTFREVAGVTVGNVTISLEYKSWLGYWQLFVWDERLNLRKFQSWHLLATADSEPAALAAFDQVVARLNDGADLFDLLAQ